MMLVKLSSKGQLVIPKQMRQELGLEAGDALHADIVGRKIILRPQKNIEERLAALNAMYGSSTGEHDLIADLEREHRQEIERDEQRVAGYVGRDCDDPKGAAGRIERARSAG